MLTSQTVFQSLGTRIRNFVAVREFSLIGVLVIIGLVMALVSPVFLTWSNIEAILLGLSVEGTIAIGMVVLLISGGLDLSVGSTLAFTGVVTGLALMNLSLPTPIAILLGLFAALVVGFANGILVSKLKINPFITTLGMLSAVRGLLLVLAQGRAVSYLCNAYRGNPCRSPDAQLALFSPVLLHRRE